MAAGNSGLLDEAVSGYVQLTLLDPPAAVGRELPVEEAGEEQLARAVGQLQQALENRSLRPDQRKPLLTLLLALQTRRGDQEAAARVVEQLAPIVGENPDEDPKLYTQVMLGRATLSLSRNEPDEAVRLINANQQVFTDAQQQSEALMILARAAEQRAGEDRGGLLDASLAYMKVVAHFRRAEGAPNVPEALLRVGAIHERLGLSTAAAGLYQEIVTTYPQSPVAAEAQRRLEAVQPPSATRPAGGF